MQYNKKGQSIKIAPFLYINGKCVLFKNELGSSQ